MTWNRFREKYFINISSFILLFNWNLFFKNYACITYIYIYIYIYENSTDHEIKPIHSQSLQKAIFLTIVRSPLSLGWTRRLKQEICEQLILMLFKISSHALHLGIEIYRLLNHREKKQLRFSSFLYMLCNPNNKESSNNSAPLHLEMIITLKKISYAYLLVFILFQEKN